MRTIIRGNSIIYLLLIFILSIECIRGQIGAHYYVVPPYEGQDMLSRRMGGVTVALPDEVPQILGNPAGLAYIDKATFFLSMSHAESKLDFAEIESEQASSHTWSGSLVPGNAAVSLPLELFWRRWVVAVAYNNRQSPEYNDETYIPPVKELIELTNEREGQIGSASVGIGVELLHSLSLGIGWTKWFGEMKWSTIEALGDLFHTINRQTTDYNGSGWHAGVMGQAGRLSLGAVIYFPQELVTGEGVPEGYYFTDDIAYEQSLKFNGGFKGGVAYNPISSLTLGLGYSYRHGFIDQYRTGGDTLSEEYGSSTGLSGGIEYTLNLNKVHLPVYFGYFTSWMPEFPSFGDNGLVSISKDDRQRYSDRYSLGAGLIYGPFGLHLNAQWAQRSLTMSLASTLLPPWT